MKSQTPIPRRWLATALLALAALPATQATQDPPTAPPARIVDGWYAHNAMLAMLGASQQIVATVAKPQVYPWMYRIAPALAKAEVIDSGALNVEELLRLHTQLAFVIPRDPSVAALQRAGIHVIKVEFHDFPSLLDCLHLTTQTLNTPLARQRAEDYQRYLTETEREVGRRSQAIAAAKRPRVLHIVSLQPLKVDGDDTIIEEWIRLAGGRNAATGVHSYQQPVSIEQVLAWQPQIIILGGHAGSLNDSPQAALWNKLTAVREGKVYRNPFGVFAWDRYGPELALQLRWAQQVILDGKVNTAQLTRTTRVFYRRFFGYDLPPADALRILQAKPPLPS